MLKSALILASVVAGVLVGNLTGSLLLPMALFTLAISVRFIAAAGMKRDFTRYLFWTRLHCVWPCLLLCGLGALSAVLHDPYPADIPDDSVCLIRGRVIDRTTTTRGERYTLRVAEITTPDGKLKNCRNLKVNLWTSAELVLRPGDEVEYRSEVSPLRSPNPGDPLYNTWDMHRNYVAADLRVTGHNDDLRTMASRLRDEISVTLDRSDLSMEASALVGALLTGDRGAIRPAKLADIRDAGVAHALAVSGMHVGIIAALLLWLTLPLNLLDGGRYWRYLLVLGAVWGFVILTGLHYSTLRAAFMLTFASIGFIAERRISPFTGVCMAAVLILLTWPDSLWDVGFQLSFCCVAALTIFMEPLNPISHRLHPRTFRIMEALLVTMIATGATWVISARYFGSVPLHFLSSNIVMLPLLPFFMTGSIIYLILIASGMEAGWLAWLLNQSTDLLYRFLSLFSATSVELAPTDLTVGLWMCGIVAAAVAVHRFRHEERTLPGAVKLPQRLKADGSVPLHRPSAALASAFFMASLLTL